MNRRWLIAAGVLVAASVTAVTATVAAAQNAAAGRAGVNVQLQTPLDSHGVDQRETNLGDVIADAARAAGQADAAVIDADEITETTLGPGSVPADQIVKALRYADDPTDTVVILKLTGAQLRQMLERSVSRAPQPFDGFLQISGLQIHYSASAPEGKRITLVLLNGTPLEESQVYQVATSRSLANGSFGYFRDWGNSSVARDTETTLAAALGQYLSQHRTLNAVTEDRISS